MAPLFHRAAIIIKKWLKIPTRRRKECSRNWKKNYDVVDASSKNPKVSRKSSTRSTSDANRKWKSSARLSGRRGCVYTSSRSSHDRQAARHWQTDHVQQAQWPATVLPRWRFTAKKHSAYVALSSHLKAIFSLSMMGWADDSTYIALFYCALFIQRQVSVIILPTVTLQQGGMGNSSSL